MTKNKSQAIPVAIEIDGKRYALRETKRSPFPGCRSCAVRRHCGHSDEQHGNPLCIAVPHPADRFVRFVREKSPIRAALERVVRSAEIGPEEADGLFDEIRAALKGGAK